MKTQRLSYPLALALCFNGYYATAPTIAQAQQPSAQQSKPAAGANAASSESPSDGKQLRSPDVVYVPTPYEAVEAMLKVAKVGKDDVVYDLGFGRRAHPDHGGAEVQRCARCRHRHQSRTHQ